MECQKSSNGSSALRASTHPGCFACGEGNPRGMRLRFRTESRGDVTAVWKPTPEWEGFRGIVHGGVVSTVLDEAMSKAVASLPREALTAELRVRFRNPVRSSATLLIRGWVHEQAKRRIVTEAILSGEDGTEHAHAWAVFLELPA